MNIDSVKFQVGQTVYRKLKPSVVGMITAVVFRENYVEYRAIFSDQDSELTYQAIELTNQKAFVVEESDSGGTA